MEILYLLIGIIIGFAIAWFYSRSRNQSAGITKAEAEELGSKIDTLSNEKVKG